MRLKYLLFAAFLLVFASRATAQKVTDVLNWGGEITWHKHLIQQMHEQYRQRDKEIQQAFKSKTMAQDYLQKIRQNYASIQGSFPPKSPLNARVTGTIQRDGYHIEKVVYESFSNHHVTANLRSEEHTSELQSRFDLVCRLLLEKKKIY